VIAPAGNYVEWQPNRSIRWPKLTTTETLKWEQLYNEAKTLLRANKWRQALERFKACQTIDSSFAQTDYETAEVLLKLQDFNAAKQAFKAAVSHDGAPMIASPLLIKQSQEICELFGIPFIDANKVFESHSKNDISDPIFFADAHHPTWQGDLLIAQALADTIKKYYMTSEVSKRRSSLKPIEYLQKLHVTQEDSMSFFISRANWYLKVSDWRWENERRLAKAKDYIDKALKLDPSDTKTLITNAMWACFEGKTEVTKINLNHAKTDRNLYRQIMNSPWVRNILARCQNK